MIRKFQIARAETKTKGEMEPKRLSPFSEMSRRDEGDGRSIADSNCSSYKNTQYLNYHTGDKKKPNVKVRTLHPPIPSQRRTKPT